MELQIELLAFQAVGILLLTSTVLLISSDWRWGILALAGQYVGVFLIVWLSWPLEMAVVKLVAGWMAGAVLGLTMVGIHGISGLPETRTINRLFRFFASGLVILVVFSLAPRLIQWVPQIRVDQVWAAALLIGMGLLHLGLTSQPLRVILALLTVLAGFEVLYAALESSTLVAGLLASVNLGLALVGSYMLLLPTLEESP